MATDLNALKQLLAQSSIAQGKVPELEAQLARANALRDTPAPTGTQQLSYTSPLSHLVRGFNQIRGQGQATRATGGLSQARQQLAESDVGEKMYGLETTADQRIEDVDFRNLKEGNIAKRALTKSLADQTAATTAYDRNVTEQQRREGVKAKILADKTGYERGQFGEHETVWKADNTPIQVAIADDGKSYINVHTGETITEPFTTQNPNAKGGALYKTAPTGQSGIPYQQVKGKDAQGNEVVGSFDKRTGIFTPTQFTATGQTWTPELAGKYGGKIATQAGAEEHAKAESKSNIKREVAAYESSKSLIALQNELKGALSALKAGASTGPISSRLPTLTESTAALENIADRIALHDIGNYTFGALSDAEGAWLKRAGLPMNLQEDTLERWVNHRIEAIDRLIAANAYEEDLLKNGFELETEDRDYIQTLLHSNGFKFED